MLAGLIVRAELGGAARTTRPEELHAPSRPRHLAALAMIARPLTMWHTDNGSLSRALADRHVVDQPRPADARGDQQAACALAQFVPSLQAGRIGKFGVIDR